MAEAEDLDEVEALLPSSESPLDAWDMACVLDAVAATADHDVALALADRAETLLGTGGGLDHSILLQCVTLLLARHGYGLGHVERTLALADRLDPDLCVGRQAEIAGEAGPLRRHGRGRGSRPRAQRPWGTSQGTDRSSPRAGQPRRSGPGRSPHPPDRRPLGTRRRSGRGRPGGGSVRRSGPGRGPSPTRSPTARHEPEHWPHSRSCPSPPTPAGLPHRSWFSTAGPPSCRFWSGSCPVQWRLSPII